MQAVIFSGVQASGKTTFYVERFLTTMWLESRSPACSGSSSAWSR